MAKETYGNKFYVYEVKVDGVVRYYGKGSGNRYAHCKSGKSSCVELNRDYFEGKTIDVTILKKDMFEVDADKMEQELIRNGEDLYNIVVAQRGNKPTRCSKLKGLKTIYRYYSSDSNGVLKKEISKLALRGGEEELDKLIDAAVDLGLELIIMRREGGSNIITLDTEKYPDKLTCLACGSYPGENSKCLDYDSSWCRLTGGPEKETPGWMD